MLDILKKDLISVSLILKGCQNLGIYVVMATARYWIGAERYIDEIKPDYAITTDGTLIHRHGEQIYICIFKTKATNKIIKDLLARRDLSRSFSAFKEYF